MTKFPILMYHDIIEPDTQTHKWDPIYSVEENNFIKQIEYLRNSGYQSISLDKYLKLHRQPLDLKSNESPITKPIIITFDDGHVSNYTRAFALLQEYGFVATFFVTVKNIGSTTENQRRRPPLLSPRRREDKERGEAEHNEHGMTWQQLREMADSGMSIQSHTMTHPFLSDLDAKQIRWELAESKSILESELGRPVNHLALPGGRYSSMVKRIAKEVGYQTVSTSKIDINTLTSDLYALKRWAIKSDTNLSTFSSIVEMKPSIIMRHKAKYFLLNGLKKTLGNKRYLVIREKLLQRTFLPGSQSGAPET